VTKESQISKAEKPKSSAMWLILERGFPGWPGYRSVLPKVIVLIWCLAVCQNMQAAADMIEEAMLSSLSKEVHELYQGGKFAEGIPVAQEWLELSEKTLGANDPQTALALRYLTLLYVRKGDYAKAEPLLLRAIKISEKVAGPDHPETASALDALAALYSKIGQDAKAEPLYRRVLEIREKARGPDDSETDAAVTSLAALYSKMGDYAKAEPLLQRAIQISERTRGPNHPETATAVNNLGALYVRGGNYAKAEPLFQRALRILEEARGPDHSETAAVLNNLAALYNTMGDYAKAEPLFQRALKISEKALGPDDPQTATALNNLAEFYKTMGDYAEAEPLYQRALTIREKVLGPDDPQTATALNNLAEFYKTMGDYAKAEPLYQRVLAIREKVLGPDHPETARVLINLAHLYYSKGDYAKAEPLYQRALEISGKALGPDHPQTATALNNLAQLYQRKGDYAKAEPLYQRALKIDEKALGPDHPETATAVNNLGSLYFQMGDYAKAEPLYQRALKIREKALGADHPDTADNLNNLAVLKIDLGQMKEALSLVVQARRAEEKYLSNILSFTSEEQRLTFQKTTHPYTLPATLGEANELAQTVLRQKGVVLDSLLEDHLVAEASADPKQRLTIEQLRAAKQRLTQLLLEVPKDLSEQAQKTRASENEKLSSEVEQLEAGLARQVAGLGKARRALSVTVAQVQSVLPKQGVLVEFLRYNHYLGKYKCELRYGAVVIAAAVEPKWIPLGAAAGIEKNIRLYNKSVRGITNEATLSTVLKTLQEQVWAPIQKAFPSDANTVAVSPDAELSFVSFSTLLTPDEKFVGEKYSIRYVASGRDLLREVKTVADPKTTIRIFANPHFAAKTTGPGVSGDKTNDVALRSAEMRELRGIALPSLPGTQKEFAALEALANKSGWKAEGSLWTNATEAELRKVSSPRVLHLATHGFFLPEGDLGPPPTALSRTAAEVPKGKLTNPMHRSGVALAGAQTTLQGWGKGEVPPIEADGVVTAEEVGGLKLSETWLVVLSACDTGGGEAKAGEGVMGLRRGFVQSGTQNLLMTLWPISDETTVQIMLDFYAAAFKSGNAPQALADTQRDWLVKLRKEHGLLAAVRLAGPFILSSQGKQ
jgi:tetratricopeptide (TPR) repeat protein/CHAT domain-containing protein